MGGRRQNTILVKVPAHEDSQDEQESGSETSDSMPGGGQGAAQNHNNVTLITLNSEGKAVRLPARSTKLSVKVLIHSHNTNRAPQIDQKPQIHVNGSTVHA